MGYPLLSISTGAWIGSLIGQASLIHTIIALKNVVSYQKAPFVQFSDMLSFRLQNAAHPRLRVGLGCTKNQNIKTLYRNIKNKAKELRLKPPDFTCDTHQNNSFSCSSNRRQVWKLKYVAVATITTSSVMENVIRKISKSSMKNAR